MLNRRILRVKAMQALYSYFTTRESLKEVMRERLEAQYHPDPAKDDFSESDKFKARRKLAARLFNQHLKARKVSVADGTDIEVADATNVAIGAYYKDLDKERRNIRDNMMMDVDRIHKLYLQLVSLPVELAHLEKLEKEKKERAHIYKTSEWRWHFIANPLIEDLTRLEFFNKEIISHKISWAGDLDQVKSWYKEILKKDEELHRYQTLEQPTAEDHKAAILHLYKKVIFKDERIDEFMAERDIHWVENKSILKSLIVKTFQDYEPELDPPYELREVSRNEEEDLVFFKELFEETLKQDEYLDELIAKRIKNWDISRVAMIDLIILKMAITEMMIFPSIPVKVTINEFIEVSKQYSTPKSKQFVNGILDVLANELTSEGVIKKSGRGLIDNK